MSAIQRAAPLMYLNAALHVLVPILGLFSTATLIMLPVALLYGAFGWGLSRDWRSLGYFVFVCAAFGGVVAYGFATATAAPLSWAYWGIVGVDALVAVMLFLALWRPRPAISG